MKDLTGEHAFVHENISAYLLGGLDTGERSRFDAHINTCPECFDAFSEARDADRALLRTLGDLAPAGGPGELESRLSASIAAALNAPIGRWRHPAVRRAAYATAAAVALAATGVFANIAMRQGGRMSNPLAQAFAEKADAQDSDWGARNHAFTRFFVKDTETSGSHWVDGTMPLANDTAVFDYDRLPRAKDLNYDRVVSIYKKSVQDSKDALAKGEFQIAKNNAQQALEVVEQNRSLLPSNEYVAMHDGSTAMLDMVNSVSTQNFRDRELRLSAQGSDDQRVRLTNASEQRRLNISSLVTDARKLYDAAQFKESADLLRQATIIDPGNVDAQLMFRLVQDKIAARDYEAILHRNGQEGIRQTIDSSEHLIPYADLMIYPDNWAEIQRKRGEGQIASAGQPSFSDLYGVVAAGDVSPKKYLEKTDPSQPVGGATNGRGVTPARPGVETYALMYDGKVKNVNGSDDVGFEFGLNGKLRDAPAATTNDVASAGNGQPGNATFFKQGSASVGMNGQQGNGGQGSFDVALTPMSSTPSISTYTQATPGQVGGNVAKSTEEAGKAMGGDVNSTKVEQQLAQPLQSLARADQKYISDKPNVDEGQKIAYGDAHVDLFRGSDVHEVRDMVVSGNVNAPKFNLSNMSDKEAIKGLGAGAANGEYFFEAPKTGSQSLIALANPPLTPPPATQASPTVTTTPATRPVGAEVQSLKIIRNGTLEFEVRSFDDTYRIVARIAQQDGGFIASTSSEKLANGHVRGTIVVRIPPAGLEDFLSGLRGLGDLKAQHIGAADVTKDYYDIDSEIRGLTTMETRLLELAKNPKGEVKDLAEVEKQLGDVRVRMEKLKGQISYYNNLVSLATIAITAYEKDIASPTAASEQENIVANLETEEVEAKYTAARKIFDDAKGRIVESQLKNTDADHIAAHIVADVPPEKADFVAAQLKQLGKVASFTRDRKQTTAGGTGAPVPGVQVEQKDTRFTIELYNLANLAPRETTVLRVAVKDVEASYRNLLAIVKQPSAGPAPAPAGDAAASQPTAVPQMSGRVTAANLTGQQAEQMQADVRAELRTDNADTILAAIKASGEVLGSSVNTNQDATSTTSAKRGLVVTLVNVASVNPKEADNIVVAVKDVDAAYKAALTAIRKEAPAPTAGTPNAATIALLPPAVGRVVSSTITGQQPIEMRSDIQAQLRADQATDLVAALKAGGEVLANTSTENADTTNVTRAKRGLRIQFINIAAVSPRETVELRGVAVNVVDSYQALLASLKDLAAKGEVRIVGSSLQNTDSRTVSARMTFEAQRASLETVEKAFAAAGLEFPVRNTSRSNDSVQALDSKVGFNLVDIRPVETLEPKRTITLSMEVSDVGAAVSKLRGAMLPLSPRVKESDFTVSRDANTGMMQAHIVLDTYVSTTPTVLSTVDSLTGIQKSYQESRNSQAPETKSYTKERVDLLLTSRPLLVQPDHGFGTSFRAALTSALGALFLALYYLLTGILFLGPFILVAWPIWAIMKRRKGAKPA